MGSKRGKNDSGDKKDEIMRDEVQNPIDVSS
jgi:hypothetical protein